MFLLTRFRYHQHRRRMGDRGPHLRNCKFLDIFGNLACKSHFFGWVAIQALYFYTNLKIAEYKLISRKLLTTIILCSGGVLANVSALLCVIFSHNSF